MAAAGEGFARLLERQGYQMLASLKQVYIDALKQYHFVGGMPKAEQGFTKEKDFNQVRAIQRRILIA